MTRALLVVLIACGKSAEPLDPLEQEAMAVSDANQPKLDALSDRVTALKRLPRNKAGWENMMRNAEIANDTLGRWPFEQIAPPIIGAWHPAPNSLMAIRGVVRDKAHQLARDGKTDALRALIDDEKRRYAEGIARVDGQLAEVEAWVKAP